MHHPQFTPVRCVPILQMFRKYYKSRNAIKWTVAAFPLYSGSSSFFLSSFPLTFSSFHPLSSFPAFHSFFLSFAQICAHHLTFLSYLSLPTLHSPWPSISLILYISSFPSVSFLVNFLPILPFLSSLMSFFLLFPSPSLCVLVLLGSFIELIVAFVLLEFLVLPYALLFPWATRKFLVLVSLCIFFISATAPSYKFHEYKIPKPAYNFSFYIYHMP